MEINKMLAELRRSGTRSTKQFSSSNGSLSDVTGAGAVRQPG
jgi:hypothetical protein